jgi:hypothetical protein
MPNGLKRFLSGEYDDYKFGDPRGGAENLIELISNFQQAAEAEIAKAGPYLSPAMRQAVKDQLKDILK